MTTSVSRLDAQHRTDTIKLLHYAVHLDVSDAADPHADTFPTSTAVAFLTSDPVVVLDFIGHNVNDVTVNGKRTAIEYDGVRLTLRNLPTDTELLVQVDAEGYYSRMGQGLCRYVDAADGNTFLYTQAEPSDARRYFACFDQPDLKAPITVSLTGPEAWELVGNMAAVTTVPAGRNRAGQAVVNVTFAPTPPLSTFLVCVGAGPYEVTRDAWTGATPDGELTIPIAVYARPSQRTNADPAFVIDVTKRGLRFFHDEYHYTYPWGKYDYLFAPEYNAGAMENPGLVTVSDTKHMHPPTAPSDRRENAAITLMHEMSHMWFGDLVTPAWWDDLWLKESFAEFAGVDATARVTEFTDAWTNAVIRRKFWAYEFDGRPTTHPILADIPDTDAASQNFDGVTYSKGAAVLRQLVHYVGRDAFVEASRRYFANYAFGATSMSDFLAELETASGRDMGEWTRLWLGTSGASELAADVEHDGTTITSLAITQDSVDPVTGDTVLRPHLLVVGLYYLVDGVLERRHRLVCDIDGPRTVIPDAAGLPLPQLVLVNDEDLTYASVILRDADVDVLCAHLHTIADPLSRASALSTVMAMVRFGYVPARRLVDITVESMPHETNAALARTAVERALEAVTSYTAFAERGEHARRLLDVAWTTLCSLPEGSELQEVWANSVALVSALTGERADAIRAWLQGAPGSPTCPLTHTMRWQLWRALAATGNVTAEELQELLDADPASNAKLRYLQAWAALPTPGMKATIRERMMTDTSLSNHELWALAQGYSHVGPGHDIAEFTDDYLQALETVWASRSLKLAEVLVVGMFPSYVTADPRLAVTEHEVPRKVHDWLERHLDAPPALRRTVMSLQSDLLRSLAGQQLSLATLPVEAG